MSLNRNPSVFADNAVERAFSAHDRRDANAFISAMGDLADAAEISFAKGRMQDAARFLELYTLCNGRIRPFEKDLSGEVIDFTKFIMDVMFLFSVNGDEVGHCIGHNEEIDAYLFEHKVDLMALNFEENFTPILKSALKYRMHAEFFAGFYSLCSDLIYRQNEANDFEEVKRQKSRILNQSLVSSLVEVFNLNGIYLGGDVSYQLDDILFDLFSNLKYGEGIYIHSELFNSMLSCGMRKSLGFMIENGWHLDVGIAELAYLGELTDREAARALAMVSNHYSCPYLVHFLVNADPEIIFDAMRPFSRSWDFNTESSNIIKACMEFKKSDAYDKGCDYNLAIILDVAVRRMAMKISKADSIRVIRDYLNHYEVPDKIKFMIPFVAELKGDIFEQELGL